jgi:hypothetical protein
VKVGDLVTTKSRYFIGVIIDSKTMACTHGLSSEQIRLRGENLNSHYVYWSSYKVENNPVWLKENYIIRAI